MQHSMHRLAMAGVSRGSVACGRTRLGALGLGGRENGVDPQTQAAAPHEVFEGTAEGPG